MLMKNWIICIFIVIFLLFFLILICIIYDVDLNDEVVININNKWYIKSKFYDKKYD